MEIRVTEDPVTSIWRFRLDGHDIEVETKHGFVKIDGQLHRVAAVQGLAHVDDIKGAPLAAIMQQLARLDDVAGLHGPPPHTTEVERAPIPQQKKRETRRRQTKTNEVSREKAATQPSKPPQTAPPAKGALPTPDAARYVGLSPATLETMRTRGGGPRFVKLGRRVVYRRADLDAWLDRGGRASTSDPGSCET